jgi:subtilisin family serine protease
MTAPVDSTSYCYLGGKRIPLRAEPGLIGVRFVGDATPTDDTVRPRTQRLLMEESEPVAFLPHYGIHVFHLRDNRADMTAVTKPEALTDSVRRLREDPAVEMVLPAVRRGTSSDEVSLLTRRFLAQFRPEVGDAERGAILAQMQATIVEALGYAPNAYLLEAMSTDGDTGPVATANRLYETGRVVFSHPDFVERRYQRGLEVAPRTPGLASARDVPASERAGDFLDRQWHLKTAKVTDAWATTRGDPDICIAILDDGIDTAHPEFAGKLGPQFDFQSGVADATPKASDDKHGTACAGVATAKGVKASGAAPLCRLMPVRSPALLAVADEAKMFRWASDNGAHVISCSWGPADNKGPFALPDATKSAIHYCVTNGRGGKGIPVLFAAGNGNELVSDDGYASNPEVMAIAASSERDTKAPYSDFGPEIFVCAPSSGDSTAGDRRIFTTDRAGVAGYNTGDPALGDSEGDYTSRFGGTSSASPLVAGVIGLMLSANPELTEADVRRLLRTTSDKIGDRTTYDADGHHVQFGYGRVNAQAAVEAALRERSGAPAIGPVITGPATGAPDQPPTFQIGLGGRRVYAVELATSRELLDPANEGSRSAASHYGSWVDGLKSAPSYQPPGDIWATLAAAGEVFYRLHVADDAAWTNYAVSHAPSAAPRVATAMGPGVPAASDRSVTGPRSAERSVPPTFRVSTGDRRLYAIEMTSNRDLLRAENASSRTASTHYGSWAEGLRSDAAYTPPPEVWAALAAAPEVFYRGHFADDAAWSNYVVSGDPESAPSVKITGAAVPAVTAQRVVYPSGASFSPVATADDGVDYQDPVANGIVPLIDLQGRGNELLSANFRASEFVKAGARYARVSPRLVEALQAIRARIGSGVVIDSAYRSPAANAAAGGDSQSEHLTGRAAVIRSASGSIRAVDLARAAAEAVPFDLGLGLGPTSLHVDVAGPAVTWTYDGAALGDQEFAALIANARGSRRTVRQEFGARGRPTVAGPARLARTEDLVLRIRAGAGGYYAVEVATDWRLFLPDNRDQRRPENFFASWQDPALGLRQLSPSGTDVLVVPPKPWALLRTVPVLYYRVLTTSAPSSDWPDLLESVTAEQADEAPRVYLVDESAGREDLRTTFASHGADARAWNDL